MSEPLTIELSQYVRTSFNYLLTDSAKVLPEQQYNKSADVGSSTTIAIKTSANPPPSSYAWSFDGKALKDGINGNGTDSITIQKVGMDDYGNYTCVIINLIEGHPHSLALHVELHVIDLISKFG